MNIAVSTTAPTIQSLLHISVKTSDVQATVRFYCDLLGMLEVDRPAFDFPGAWLSSPPPTQSILIHLYGGETAQDETGVVPTGSGAIDHVAITATGFQTMRRKLEDSGRNWRQNIPPGTKIWQLFVRDPNGILVELTYDGGVEEGPAPTPENGAWYNAYEHFK
jgi:catechol 2,3-dioxygenase-like lactoylglutathione lyase family enzyme